MIVREWTFVLHRLTVERQRNGRWHLRLAEFQRMMERSSQSADPGLVSHVSKHQSVCHIVSQSVISLLALE